MKKYSILMQREFAIIVALFVMLIVFTIVDPIYISSGNLLDIIEQSTINGLLAIGITFAIITGGIDLSVGSTFAIVIVTVGNMLKAGVPPFVAVLIGLVLGYLLGVVNGLLVTQMRLQPFIATLGTMSVYRGIAYVITGGWPVLSMPSTYRKMLDGDLIGDIPVSVLILFAFAFVGYIYLKYLRAGMHLYAIGNNEEATRLSGVNVDRLKTMAYGVCGVGAALSGMILLARLGTGEPTAGQGYELNAIAAAAIGGTSLAGGKGSMLGTLLGAVLLSALKVGLIVAGVDTFWQFIATGLIIIIAAYFEIIQDKIQVAGYGR
ncbi:MAG: ABC transporter permease [Sphaerochaetaceae bacterium]|nr:ABC transporter permease [Sphaerochaetaceae bacterium]